MCVRERRERDREGRVSMGSGTGRAGPEWNGMAWDGMEGALDRTGLDWDGLGCTYYYIYHTY